MNTGVCIGIVPCRVNKKFSIKRGYPKIFKNTESIETFEVENKLHFYLKYREKQNLSFIFNPPQSGSHRENSQC